MARVPDWFRKVIEYGEQVRKEAEKSTEPAMEQYDPVSYFQFRNWSKEDRDSWLQSIKAKNRKKKPLHRPGSSA